MKHIFTLVIFFSMLNLSLPTLGTLSIQAARADAVGSNVSMSFVAIKAGTFEMGSPANEVGRGFDETQHQVTLTHGFEVETTDVTQAQWIQVMGLNPSFFQRQEYCPKTYAPVNGVRACPDNPVEQVSWEDAQKFIRKLNRTNNIYTYRLPTEAEWEYVDRAGTTTAYFFGNDLSQIYSYGWDTHNSDDHTHEVASLKPNAWGLYDMVGNVAQWVQDWYGYYSSSPVTDPTGLPGGWHRVGRGSWASSIGALRSAERNYLTPKTRNPFLGFRVVRTLR